MSLVHRALVNVLGLLFVHGNGSDEDDRHGGSEILQPSLLDQPGLCVPASALHEQPVDVGPLSRRTAEVLPVLFRDVALQAHFIQRPLILTGRGLHDGRQEGLRVEEPSQPDASRHAKVRHPAIQFADAQKQVSVPCREAIEGRVSSTGPRIWHFIEEEGVLKLFH